SNITNSTLRPARSDCPTHLRATCTVGAARLISAPMPGGTFYLRRWPGADLLMSFASSFQSRQRPSIFFGLGQFRKIDLVRCGTHGAQVAMSARHPVRRRGGLAGEHLGPHFFTRRFDPFAVKKFLQLDRKGETP